MKKVAVIHFMPLEFYPPVTNFLDEASKSNQLSIRVWTTHNNKDRKVYDNKILDCISRTALPTLKEHAFIRLIRYFFFNFKCLLELFCFKPDKIIYYESFSAWPVYIYLKFFDKNKELFIHFHEYFSPKWYTNGMRLVKYYHQLEIKILFKRANWISQTNIDRVKMFREDYNFLNNDKLNIFPNYPPKKWHTKSDSNKLIVPLRTVYIGTLSLDYAYIREYCDWVDKMQGKILFHVYGYNYNIETLNYLQSLSSPYIVFFEGGIEYDEIPKTLRDYDFGLILYKALTKNYKYNESNKLFEYLACGLRVLHSSQMLGIRGYDPINVMSVDFESLDVFDISKLLVMQGVSRQSKYTTEEASKAILIKLYS